MRHRSALLLIALAPALAFAQEGQPAYPPQPPPQPYPYYPPPQQQYPYGYPPPQQQYPYGYQPPQQPPPQQLPQAPNGDPYGQPPQPPQMRPPRLVLASANEAAVNATWACAAALDQRRPDIARQKCGEALTKDDKIAFAQLLLSRAQAPDLGRQTLGKAVQLALRASPGERFFVESYRALVEGRFADARRLHEQLVQALPGEPLAFVARGKFRQAYLADLDGAIADFRQAREIDPRYAAAHGHIALALVERGQLDDALAEAKKYVAEAGALPDAHLTLARVLLRRGEHAEALAAAKKAAGSDEKYAAAHAALGDALLFSGRGKEARKEYGILVGTDDPAVHHEGAMREARSYLFEGRVGDAEKSLAAEADLSEKTRRPGDQVDALVELGRMQLDRGAVADAGQTLRVAGELLANRELLPSMADDEHRRLSAEVLQVKAMVLAAVGERSLAESRAEEMGVALRIALDPKAAERTTSLKGWIAARNRDDKTALVDLAVASRPSLRMALALAAARAGDAPRAKGIMDDLAKRCENDLEGALTRPRALAWLKTQK